jgi:hypothetical protein
MLSDTNLMKLKSTPLPFTFVISTLLQWEQSGLQCTLGIFLFLKVKCSVLVPDTPQVLLVMT